MPGQIASTYLDHSLTASKGWFQPAALDIQSAVDAAVTFDLPSGRCVTLSTGNRYPKLCTVKTGVTNTGMPLFVWHGQDSYDVKNSGTTTNGRFLHQPIGPTGIIQCLVAKGAYELETTEFDSTKSYAPGQLLTATAADTNSVTGGLLTNVGTAAGGTKVKQFTDPVCGVVSRGAFTNSDGVSVLAFWPEWLPGTAPA